MADIKINQINEQLEECLSKEDISQFKAIFKSFYKKGLKSNNKEILALLLSFFNRPHIFTDDDQDYFALIFEGINQLIEDSKWYGYFNKFHDTLYMLIDFMKINELEHIVIALLPKSRENNRKLIEAQLLLLLSNINKLRQNYDLSLLNLKQSLFIVKKEDITAFETTLLIEIGTINRLLHNYDIALEYYERAKELSLSNELHSHYIYAIENEALLFMDAGDLDSANEIFKDAYDFNTQHPNSMSTFSVVWQTKLNIRTGAHKEAISTLLSFLDGGIQRFNPLLHHHILISLGAAYCGLGQYDKAMEYLWRSYDLIQPQFIECMELFIELLDIINEVFYFIYDGEYIDELSKLLTNVKLFNKSGFHTTHLEEAVVLLELTKINELLERIRKQETNMIYLKNYQIDMNSGVIIKKNKQLSELTKIQMKIFRLMYEKKGAPVENEDIVKCSDYYYKDKIETPRRSHYYINQMRKRFGDYSIFEAVRGIGYRLNM